MAVQEDTRSRVARRLGNDLVLTPSAFVGLAGVWLLITPVVVEHGAYPWWSDVTAGAVLTALGVLQVVTPRRSRALSAGAAVVGVWLVAAPFVLSYHHELGLSWNGMIVGTLVVLLSVVNVIDALIPGPREKR